MLKAIYDNDMSYDSGVGGLRVYVPTCDGYINYNFVHTVDIGKNADTWRMTVVNITDSDLNYEHQLTKSDAEWEMAIRLADRPDFIGGFNHGDEKYTEMSATVDGESVDFTTFDKYIEFETMSITVNSEGFDPADQSVKVFDHIKEFTINKDGVRVDQQIIWCKECALDKKFKSFLAMMPPVKHDVKDKDCIITDSYYCEDEKDYKQIVGLPIVLGNTPTIKVCGKDSGIHFTMKVSNYSPLYKKSYEATMSDNGGKKNYNKMYISFAGATGEGDRDVVNVGTVWKSTTQYKIERI